MVGEKVMDRFRVLERIGSGGMGTVYRAFDERLQRDVALKEIPAADARRIMREAQAAARLNHPGIVTLYELGAEGGRALLVSELVAGSTLADLARSEALCDRDVAEIGASLCAALAHAHAHGVVHRDVKPQNVIASPDGDGGWRTKLMDFGIASLSGSPAITVTGEVLGTLAYMAPEQAAGMGAVEASDVYSLALTLYECWAGVNPVAQSTPARTALAIGEPVPSLRLHRPSLPPGLCDAMDACLEAQPDARPRMEELQEELEVQMEALDASRPLPVPVAAEAEAEPEPSSWLARSAAWVGAASGLALAGGPVGEPAIALLLALLLGPPLVALFGRRPSVLALLLLGALGGIALGPGALAGPGALLAAATSFGVVLRPAHVAVSLLGAMLWAALGTGLLALVAGSAPPGAPLVIAAAAVGAVLYAYAARRTGARDHRIRGLSPQAA